ncbi:MAG: hypothetical protein QNJ85_10705 [Gammaproteobacteria bacterium]|nr:hypothetical protein [Gammaproteobacteria bacterium]
MSKKAVQIIAVVFLFSLIYSIMRYHVFEGVGSKDFALYVFNKCLALTGFILLTINFALGPAKRLGADVPDAWLAARKEMGIVSFLMIFSHLICAVLLFGSGGYYAKFFAAEGGISAIGSWSMLLGVLAFVWLYVYNISFKVSQEGDEAFVKLVTSRGSITIATLLAAGHVTVMGFKGWLHPEKWAGGMPPITMVAIAAFLIGFGFLLFGRR